MMLLGRSSTNKNLDGYSLPTLTTSARGKEYLNIIFVNQCKGSVEPLSIVLHVINGTLQRSVRGEPKVVIRAV